MRFQSSVPRSLTVNQGVQRCSPPQLVSLLRAVLRHSSASPAVSMWRAALPTYTLAANKLTCHCVPMAPQTAASLTGRAPSSGWRKPSVSRLPFSISSRSPGQVTASARLISCTAVTVCSNAPTPCRTFQADDVQVKPAASVAVIGKAGLLPLRAMLASLQA